MSGFQHCVRAATINGANSDRMAAPQNIVAPRLRTIRREKELTQAMLAARCGMQGWDIGANTITEIETKIRCVIDAVLLCLAKAFDVRPEALLPAAENTKATVKGYFAGKPSNLVK
jgi:transcriptional regulator with XRE-family HTH domain